MRIARDIERSVRAVMTGDGGSDDAERRYFATPAANAIEWIVRPEFGNSPQLYGHFGQYQLIRDFFELRCPICNAGGSAKGQPGDCWDKTREQLEAEVLLVWDMNAGDDACPKCHTTRTELITDGIFHGYNQLHCVVGQRSGKSATAAMIGLYMEHRLITLHYATRGGLQGYLGDLPSSPYEIVYLASTAEQGSDTLWAKYRLSRNASPWIQRYIAWRKVVEAKQPALPGVERRGYEEQVKSVRHADMQLLIKVGNSNSNASRGGTRLFGAIDELDYMIEGSSRFSGVEIYRVMDNQLMTARVQVGRRKLLPWLGAIVSITSPRDPEGEAMSLLERAKRVHRMLTIHKSSWEYSPLFAEDNPELMELREKDPLAFERDFGAMPSSGVRKLIHDRERFCELAVDPLLQPTILFSKQEIVDATGHAYIGVQVDHVDFRPSGAGNAPRVICLDAGKNFDCFAIAVAHGEYDEQGRIVTIFDGVARAVPRAKVEVWFSSFEETIAAIAKKMIVMAVRYDQWQSAPSIQVVRNMGLDAEESGVPDSDKVIFMQRAYQGLIRLLPPEGPEDPFALGAKAATLSDRGVALYELVRLDRDPRTGKVYNPRKGKERGENSDDLACVCIHADAMIQRIGFTDKSTDRSLEARRKRAGEGFAAWAAAGAGAHFPSGRGGLGQSPRIGPSDFSSETGRGRGW